jgi:hypothetical protein
MAERMADERVERVLASVGDHLAVPAVVVPASAPGAPVIPLTRRRARRARVVAAAAAVVLLVLVAATVSPVQDAVARVAEWLDIGSTRIERVERRDADPSGLGPLGEGLPAVTVTEAERVLGRPLPPTGALGLGRPARLATPPEGGVLLAWRDGTTLWLLPSSDPVEPWLQKLVDDVDTVTPVPDLGDGGVVVTGSHVLSTPHRRVAAATVVLWGDRGLELRLESDRGRPASVALARALTTTG